MLNNENICALRMQRQFLHKKADENEYNALYRDISPGQNVYWNGFGDPPSITFRADFNDIEYNRERQRVRTLIKGRFQGGNLGWIEADDIELFAGLCMKTLDNPTIAQKTLLNLIEREGPMNIALMKETTGMLVKEITPILHRLQEAFLIYEDQNDGEWDRGWYKFSEMFPDVNLLKFNRIESLMAILQRFSYRHAAFNAKMVKSFYKLPDKDIKLAIQNLIDGNILTEHDEYYLLKSDCELLQKEVFSTEKSVFVMHRNDFLVRSNDYWLKEQYKHDEYDILQYILIDGQFKGAVLGHFKNGPYIIENITLNMSENDILLRKNEIIEAVYRVNNREYSPIKRYNNIEL